MKSHLAFITALTALAVSQQASAQSFLPTSGTVDWNNDANWSSAPFPNSAGAIVSLPAPTDALTINLNQAITVGSLTIGKATSGAFITTIQGSPANTFTFDSGNTLVNGPATGAAGTEVTILETPITLTAGLTITQNDDDGLRFMQPISGIGGLSINRGTSGAGTVALSNANSYSGPTVLTGNTGQNYLLVRVNNVSSIPGGIGATGGLSNITFTASAILGLRADDFKRNIGTGVDQFQFVSPAQSGWAAFTENRAVNIGGASATVTWNAAGFNPGTLVLGHTAADRTIDFQNPLNLLASGTSTVTRNIRILDGTATIDAKISGGITSPTTGTSNVAFLDAGTVQLTGPSTYNGSTSIQNAVVIFNHPDAIAPGNLSFTNTGVANLGAGDFTRSLGTGVGQVQWVPNASGNGSGGFAAFGANRIVNIGGAVTPQQLVWGSTPNFIPNTNSNFLLGVASSDATVDFQNPIDLNDTIATAARTFAVRNGSAAIDGKLSGVISGASSLGIIKGQGGTLELSAANTYQGVTTIQNGVLLLTNSNSIPGGVTGGNINTISFTNTGGQIGLGFSDFTSGLGTGPGKVQFSTTNNHGFAAYGADRAVNLGGASAQVTWGVNNFIGGQFLLGDEGADKTLDFQNPIDLNGAVRTFAANEGSANVDGLLSNVISGTGGGLQKIGNGTLKLIAANTYDGGTTITAGRLLVSNTSGSGTSSGAVTVTTGTLGGTGTIAGPVTVNTGGHIAPGESVGTLAVASLTLNTGAILDFELGAPGAPGTNSDLLNVTATDGLYLLGGSIALTNAGGIAIGTYTLIDYAGTLAGDILNLGAPTGPAGFTYSLVHNVGNTSIDLQVAAGGVPGDYNGNGVVDGADYTVWRKNNGLTGGATAAQGDGNGDGNVTAADYDFWRARFGNTAGSGSSLGSSAVVPEPATWTLVGVAASLLASRRKERSRV